MADRSSLWVGVVYPESMPSNWQDLLIESHIPCTMSPLHDKDINHTGNMEDLVKKAHYHILVQYDSLKSYNQVLKFFSEVFNSSVCAICQSKRGAFRYFLHLDNPEKHQYCENEIQYFNGFEVGDLLELSKTEQMELLGKIFKYCLDNNVCEFSSLIQIAIESCDNDMLSVIRNNSTTLHYFMDSLRHRG